jgi:hypothetical protein
MKNVTALIKDIWQTYLNGARNRDKTVLGFVVIIVISITLIIVGLLKQN